MLLLLLQLHRSTISIISTPALIGLEVQPAFPAILGFHPGLLAAKTSPTFAVTATVSPMLSANNSNLNLRGQVS